MEARSLWPGFFSAVRHVSLTAELRTPLRHSLTDGARSAIEGFSFCFGNRNSIGMSEEPTEQ